MTVDGKRAFDVAVSSMGLIVLAPLLGVIGIAVGMSSAGPVIFRQERIGRHGEIFRIHKFRTMRTDSNGPLITAATDNRVTRVGAVLRRTKLDELPQLIDVLRGDMSLVGPRPEVSNYVERWPVDARDVILSVRPGITDPVTLSLVDESERLADAEDVEHLYLSELLPRKVDAYVAYVSTRTFSTDLSILLNTLRALIR